MREYICEHGIADESELKQLAVKYMEQGCIIYAVNTSSFYCGTELNIDVQHLLELRIITESAEFKAFRSNIGTEFAWRYINDETFKIQLKNEENGFLAEFDNRVYDEEHYLDIDNKKNKRL